MVLDSVGNWAIGISVMIVHGTLILVKRVTCDTIERYHVNELTQYDVSIYGYGL